jgi:hypothetical protein
MEPPHGPVCWSCKPSTIKLSRCIYDGDRYIPNTRVHLALGVRILTGDIKTAPATPQQHIRQHDNRPLQHWTIATSTHTLLLQQTAADIATTDHMYRQPLCGALVSVALGWTHQSEVPGLPDWPTSESIHTIHSSLFDLTQCLRVPLG